MTFSDKINQINDTNYKQIRNVIFTINIYFQIEISVCLIFLLSFDFTQMNLEKNIY